VNTVDPVAGSYAIEAMTDQIEEEVTRYIERIDSLGGMLPAIENGWVQGEIHESAYNYQQSIETKQRIIVGVNDFRVDEELAIPIHTPDPALEAAQIESLNRARGTRDAGAVLDALGRLENAARGSDNLMPHILECVEVYATVGEISQVFRAVHGEYKEALAI
jgi:methylmalonyl-CoA mutase N-terminal domain/subunit